MSAARLSPEFSSSILLIQSSFPVQIKTCSAYAAIVPFRGFEWSISKPSGIGGVSAQLHIGDGQDGIVGNGGGLWCKHRIAVCPDSRHVDLDIGRRNMEKEVELRAGDERCLQETRCLSNLMLRSWS